MSGRIFESGRSSAHAAALGGADGRRLVEPLRELREQRPRRDGSDDGVGQPPVELLRDLVRDRLRSLGCERVQVAADEAPREEILELPLERAAVVESAADAEDACPVGRHRSDVVARAQDDRLEPRGRAARGDRLGEVAGRRAADGLEAEGLRRRDRARSHPVLERVRRICVLQLQQELDPERVREPRRRDQRRHPRRRVIRGDMREQIAVAPHRPRCIGPDERRAGEVVVDVEGTLARGAGRQRGQRLRPLAHAAAEDGVPHRPIIPYCAAPTRCPRSTASAAAARRRRPRGTGAAARPGSRSSGRRTGCAAAPSGG